MDDAVYSYMIINYYMYVGHWTLWHGLHDAIKGNEMLHMANTEDFHIFLYNIILKFLH